MAALTVSNERPADGGTCGIEMTFTDHLGEAVVPTTAKWSLFNRTGGVINSKQDMTISGLDSTVTIPLSGNDLLYADGKLRRLLVEYTYTSSLGTNLPNAAELQFNIQDLVHIS